MRSPSLDFFASYRQGGSLLRINGVASFITNKQQLVDYLGGITASNITSFKIEGDDIEAKINKPYSLDGVSTFENNNNVKSYFAEKNEGRLGTGYFKNSALEIAVNQSKKYISSYYCYENSNLKYGFFENADTLYGYKCFAFVNNARIYLGNLQFLEITGGANSPFANSSVKCYVPSTAPAIPGLDPGERIDITDYTTPASVSDLTAAEIGGSYVKLNFTPIAAADFYEVWIKKQGATRFLFHQEIDSPNSFILNLEQNTSYEIKIATCDQFWNGSGFFQKASKQAFSNTLTTTTTTTPTLFTNAVAYYKLDETTGQAIDVVNGFNGVLNGTISRDGQWYNYGTNNSYVEIPDQDDFSFVDAQGNNTDFVIKTEVIFDGFNSSNRAWLVSKRATASAGVQEWQLILFGGKLSFYIWDNANTEYTVDYTFSPTIGQKYILGVTLNGTTLDLFLDGVIIATTQLPAGITLFNGTSPVKLGNEIFTSKLNLVGRQKETTIIKGAGWSAGEISDNYNNGNGVTI